jgi:hypothetical protein
MDSSQADCATQLRVGVAALRASAVDNHNVKYWLPMTSRDVITTMPKLSCQLLVRGTCAAELSKHTPGKDSAVHTSQRMFSTPWGPWPGPAMQQLRSKAAGGVSNLLALAVGCQSTRLPATHPRTLG